MFERILVLIIIYTAILAYDGPKLKHNSRRERLTYAVVMLVSGYLSLAYVTDLSWPNLKNVFDVLFADSAQRIVEFLGRMS